MFASVQPRMVGLPLSEASICKRTRRYGVSSPSLFQEKESAWFASRPFTTRMGRIPWDRTTSAAVYSRSPSPVPKIEVGKRVRVSPPVAPRVEASVNSACVVEEDSVPICVLSHDIFKIQVELRSTESNKKSVLTEACLDTGAG
jgi:hypothetical protein